MKIAIKIGLVILLSSNAAIAADKVFARKVADESCSLNKETKVSLCYSDFRVNTAETNSDNSPESSDSLNQKQTLEQTDLKLCLLEAEAYNDECSSMVFTYELDKPYIPSVDTETTITGNEVDLNETMQGIINGPPLMYTDDGQPLFNQDGSRMTVEEWEARWEGGGYYAQAMHEHMLAANMCVQGRFAGLFKIVAINSGKPNPTSYGTIKGMVNRAMQNCLESSYAECMDDPSAGSLELGSSRDTSYYTERAENCARIFTIPLPLF